MPVHPVKGRPGCYQWGDSGKVYCGDGAKEKAEAQQRAAYANGYRGKAEMMMPASDEYQYGDDRWWLYLTWEIKDKDTLMAYRDEGRFQIWILLQPYHYNRGKQYGGKITFICTAKYADAKTECERWIAKNLPHTKGEPQYIRRSMNKDVRDDGKYYSVDFLGLTYNEEAYGRKHLDGYYAAEEDKKNFTTIEDIEVGDVFKFGDGWERFVLKSKEIDGYEFDDEDGEIILYKIVFDPYKPSPFSDINGLVKSNVKMVRWNNPYLRMAKRRAGIKEAEELGLDEFRDGLYNLFIKGKITEEQFIAWGNDYEAYLEGDKTEKPPFAAEDFDKEISFIEKKYTKEQLRDLLNANYHKRTFPDKIWGTKTYEYGIDDELLEQTPLRKLSMAYSYEMGKRNHWLKGKKKYDKTDGLAEWRWVQKRKDGRIISNPKMRLGAESEKKPYSVEIARSSNPEKKLMAIFSDKEGSKIKTTHFGQRGASDYTKHGDKERMERYLERHGGGTTTSTKEDWKDPTTAGALSRWILWNKPSLSGSFSDFKRRFGLKGTMKVSKSAEGKLSSAQKSLNKWTKEDWGTKSGKPSTQGKDATGERYLPRKAREALTDKEYARTSAKKRRDTAKGKQFSQQPDDIEEKVKKYRAEQPVPKKDIVMDFYEEMLYDEDSDLFKIHQELNPPNQEPYSAHRAMFSDYGLYVYSFWKDEVPKNNRNGTPKNAKQLVRSAHDLQRKNPKKLPIRDSNDWIWAIGSISQDYKVQGTPKNRYNTIDTPWVVYKNKIYYLDTGHMNSLNNDIVKKNSLAILRKERWRFFTKIGNDLEITNFQEMN